MHATLRAVARVRCPYCHADTAQRWEAGAARPAVLWSRCLACGEIAIWERGSLVFPTSRAVEALTTRVPLAAQAALLVAARRQRDEVAARLSSVQNDLVDAETQHATVLHFLERFTRYDVVPSSALGRPLRLVR